MIKKMITEKEAHRRYLKKFCSAKEWIKRFETIKSLLRVNEVKEIEIANSYIQRLKDEPTETSAELTHKFAIEHRRFFGGLIKCQLKK